MLKIPYRRLTDVGLALVERLQQLHIFGLPPEPTVWDRFLQRQRVLGRGRKPVTAKYRRSRRIRTRLQKAGRRAAGQ